MYGEERNACRVLVEKSKEKRPRGRLKVKRENYCERIFKEFEKGVDWINLARKDKFCLL